MPAGRPSEYNPKFVDAAYEYAVNFAEYGDPAPTLEGFCDEIKISKQTAHTWSESHPEFLDALGAIKTKQGRLLQAKGLTGDFAPVITKLMLSANHGMAEKNETDVTSKGQKIGTAAEVIAAIESPRQK